MARGDVAAAIATATELLRLSEDHGIIQHRHNALTFLGWALAQLGETAEGIARLEEALEIRNQLGARLAETRALGYMGEAMLAARRYTDGLDYAGRALQIASEMGEQWLVARLHQLRGELLRHTAGSGGRAAETSLKEALAVAQEQGAKGWELRAATSLARLWFDRGRRDDAREQLTPIYGWFTEGFDMPDLQQAKALLDAVS